MLKPDYNRCIINLVAAITGAFGAKPNNYERFAPLIDPENCKHPIVLLIIDGLGDTFLRTHPESFLCRHRKGRLSSVFPPTTATAVTSFFTGTAPLQHGITGWHTFFKELGTVGTVLPFTPRHGGCTFSGAGISPAQLIAGESRLNELNVPCHVLLPHYFVDSDYSRTLAGTALRHGYENPGEMFEQIASLADPQQPGLIIGYWPQLDSLAHTHGMASRETAAHFLALDRECEKALPALAAQGITVIISADHGLIDTSKENIILLADHPELAAMLTLPLCGEPRCAFCYVRTDQGEAFEKYIREKLGFACELKKSSDLIREGWLGKGVPTDRITERIGDYALLMKENYIIKDRLINEKPFHQIGVHGGTSEEELYVPLIVI